MLSNSSDKRETERQRLDCSIFVPSSLDQVAEAVSAATDHEKRVYVERIGNSYRWSLTHCGGAYPLLRITARFLRRDYHGLVIGFRSVAEGVCVLRKDSANPEHPDAWAVIEFDGPAESADVKERIVRALEPRRNA